MDYRQKANRGEYIPAFFEMYLKIDGEIDLNKLSERDFSLFFHEYIHFLQDITTTYGLTTCYAYGEYVQSVVNDIYAKVNKPLKFRIYMMITKIISDLMNRFKMLHWETGIPI